MQVSGEGVSDRLIVRQATPPLLRGPISGSSELSLLSSLADSTLSPPSPSPVGVATPAQKWPCLVSVGPPVSVEVLKLLSSKYCA